MYYVLRTPSLRSVSKSIGDSSEWVLNRPNEPQGLCALLLAALRFVGFHLRGWTPNLPAIGITSP